MFWKRWAYRAVLVGFLVMSSFNMAGAAESDTARLIELLKNKNIINQQEAEQLLKEVKESAKQEQKEREEIKAAAKKGGALPVALQGFKFSTTIFAEWNNKVIDSGPSLNQFNLNRAYFTLTKDVNDWLGMNVTADLFTSKDANDKGNGLELRLKYAYASLKLLGTYSELGMIHTPSNYYDNSIWPYRVQGKNLLPDLGIQDSADLGVANQGVFGGYMDDDYLKFAAKPFAGKWGGYFIGLYNGPGYTQTEANNNKVVSGVVYLRPLPSVPVLKGMQLAYAGAYGKSNANFNPATEPGTVATDFPDFQANVAQISLQDRLFTIMGQYYWGKGTATSAEDFSRKAYQVNAFVRIPAIEKVRVFGKYQYYDPNTDKDNNSAKKIVAGLSYDASKELLPFVAYEKKTFDTNTTTDKDYDQYQVGFQLKF